MPSLQPPIWFRILTTDGPVHWVIVLCCSSQNHLGVLPSQVVTWIWSSDSWDSEVVPLTFDGDATPFVCSMSWRTWCGGIWMNVDEPCNFVGMSEYESRRMCSVFPLTRNYRSTCLVVKCGSTTEITWTYPLIPSAPGASDPFRQSFGPRHEWPGEVCAKKATRPAVPAWCRVDYILVMIYHVSCFEKRAKIKMCVCVCVPS